VNRDHSNDPDGRSRREFIRTGVAAATTLAAAACARPVGSTTNTTRGVCYHDCPESCPWIVTTEKGKAVELTGDPANPYTQGKLCNKMDGFLTDVVYNPERVLYPLKRVGDKGEAKFERVGWDEALDDVAARLRRIVDEYGADAILPYKFAGTMGLVQGWSLDQSFFARLGASKLGHTICGSTAGSGISVTLGSSTGLLPEDLRHSRLIVMWGGNPVVSNPHGWTLVERARAAGARLVVIDPLRSPTAARADLHLRPRPGTDAALALGLMHVIVREGWHDTVYLERHTVGFDQLAQRLEDYPVDRVAGITGVDADAIVALAESYATTRPAAIQLHVGMEKHRHGGSAYRAIACLPAVVGAWREPGGGLLYNTGRYFDESINWAAVTSGGDGTSTRTINMVQLGRALTDASLAPPLQSLIVYDSNPATIAPNQNLVLQGLRRPELFTVVLEHFITDTARYADYVFPATTQAEHLDLIVPYGTRYLALNRPAIEPLGEALPNTEFFRRLANRLGFTEDYLYSSDEHLIRLALGSDHPYLKGISFERLWEEGWAPLDLPGGAPFAEGGFPTPSGKCELLSEAQAAQGLDPLPAYVADARDDDAQIYPLRFMSPKWSRYFINSSHANQPRLENPAGAPRLRIHPGDARRRGIAEGDRVKVFNKRGALTLTAELTDAMQPDIVVMLHGWWGSRIGASTANALTPDDIADLGGGSMLHDTWVQVKKTTWQA
jgi:anaerobic selenocysteine-containing dehydrogenase